MATGIGLDIGALSTKIAVVEGSARSQRLVLFHEQKLEAGQARALGPDDLASLLKRLFAERRVPGGNLVTAMPAASCLTREVTVPFVREDQIRKTIKFQAESVFHAVSIDDLIVDYYKLSQQGERSRLFVIGMKKALLRERLSVLESAGLDPTEVDLDATALLNALSLLAPVKEGKRVLGVDLGGATMKMVAIEGGMLRGLRSTRLRSEGIKVGEKRPRERPRSGPVSLDDLKENLSDAEREDLFFAEQDEGRLPVVILDEEQSELFDFAEAPEAERQDVLEKVFLEIDRTLASTRLDGPLDLVLLTGGGAAVEGIETAFAEHFAAPCERVSFAGALPSKLDRRAAEALERSGGVALGLALKAIGQDAAGLDFRQEEFAFQGKFEKAKRGVACALVLLFVLFFVIAYNFQIVELYRLGTKQDYVRRYQRDIYLTLFPEEATRQPPDDYLFALRKREKDLKQRLKGFDVPDVVSALDMLRDLAQGFEESGKKATLKELALKQRSSLLRLEIDDELMAFDLKNAVNRKPRLVTLEEGRVTPDSKTGKVNVEFRVNTRETEAKKKEG